jgi:hypothetical protein
MEHGTWNMEHGTWNMEHGTWNLIGFYTTVSIDFGD